MMAQGEIDKDRIVATTDAHLNHLVHGLCLATGLWPETFWIGIISLAARRLRETDAEAAADILRIEAELARCNDPKLTRAKATDAIDRLLRAAELKYSKPEGHS